MSRPVLIEKFFRFPRRANLPRVGAVDLAPQISGGFPSIPFPFRSTASITNFGLQTLFRDAVFPLVPMGDDILDERRGRRP